MNRRGISDTVTYDEAAVRQRYGFGPERYLDYAALRGDPSDNIDGVPGIGEKTAAKLVQTYGTLEAIFEHLDELPPKNRERLGEAQTRLLENREFFRFRSREELAAHGAPVEILDVSAKDLQMGRWDAAEVRRLFDSLEFRTLYERLGTDLPAAAPQGGLSAEAAEVTGIAELEAAIREAARSGVVTMRVAGEKSHPRSAPTSLAVGVPGGARAGARVARLENLGSDPEAVWAAIREPLASARLATHASKDALLRLAAADLKPAGIAMDTEIAAYLVDPARGSYPLDELVAQYLGRELRLEAEPVEGQQALLLDAAGGPADEGAGADLALGAEVVAVSELATLLEKEGWSVGLVNMRSLKPVDEEVILRSVQNSRMLVTIEDHLLTGGLYSIVAETLLKHRLTGRVLPLALKERWFKPGLLNEVLETEGFTAEKIAATVLQEMPLAGAVI